MASLAQQVREMHEKLEEPGKLLRRFVLDYMDEFYLVKYRTKSPDSIAEKLQRLDRRGDRIDHPKYLTDLLGVRVVTTFRSELPLALSMVLRCITDQSKHPYTQSPLIKDSIKEIIFYDSEKDDVDPSEIDTRIKSCLVSKALDSLYQRKQSKREYSSIHVICATDPPHEYWPLGGAPVELQIRTIFEDAWCEIDHKYNYVHVRTKANNAHDQKVEAVHLPTYRLTQALRTQQDAAVRIADQIYQIGLKSGIKRQRAK